MTDTNERPCPRRECGGTAYPKGGVGMTSWWACSECGCEFDALGHIFNYPDEDDDDD